MSKESEATRFFNYPEPKKGYSALSPLHHGLAADDAARPNVQYAIKRRPNPVLTGPFLVVAAFL